jgi:hypothetical protein
MALKTASGKGFSPRMGRTIFRFFSVACPASQMLLSRAADVDLICTASAAEGSK